ncbi:hypothetical protein NIZ92_11435 [Alcaligenes sp. 1735tsa3]|uniref:hypothetical protein n=1 Tax=Alcaligenes sp. 1735tsa3 TaxID=2953809 RepID=UPI0020A77780|nr:hypothetical protein [Alcaligenes sp. 1735tsa3]USY23936.1 hypothetical protein NIZ92_11435 [Alcaligenes sp. 1735tsa3]
MMKIILSPQVRSGDLEVLRLERQGSVLVLNGEPLELSFMGPGDHLPAGAIDHPLLLGAEIKCTAEGLEIDGLLFHIDAQQTDPAACFPDPVIITHDGVVALPAQTPPPPPPVPEPELESIETSTVEPEDEHQD